MMTMDQYNKQLAERIRKLEAFDDRPVYLAASSTLAAMVQRIFTEGRATDGSKIGEYSNKPLYVNPNNAPRKFPTKGKYGQDKFKNGEPHKTGYFEGYRNYRAAVSRPTFVNLDLFGTLKSEFSTSLQREEGGWEAVLRTPSSVGKAIGNQRRFGKAVFQASQEENDLFKEILNLELNEILNA